MPLALPPGHDVPGVALELGCLVGYLRENLPLSEGAAAYRAWITPEYWRAIENGRRLPSLAVFIMLARALGLDPRELLEALLERMHYGRGAPPVFQPALRKKATGLGLPRATGAHAERTINSARMQRAG